MDKQAVEQSRMQEDLQLKVEQSRIDAMQEGSARTIAQMELNHKKEKLQLQRERRIIFKALLKMNVKNLKPIQLTRENLLILPK